MESAGGELIDDEESLRDAAVCGIRKLQRYRKSRCIGDGGYAKVFEHVRCLIPDFVVSWGRCFASSIVTLSSQYDVLNGCVVAVKRVRMGSYRDGISPSAIAEIRALQAVDSEHVVKVGVRNGRSQGAARVLRAAPSFCAAIGCVSS
jgi:hypothetical protein